MEVLKPSITRRLARKLVKQDLESVFVENFQKLVSAIAIIEDGLQKGGAFYDKAYDIASILLSGFQYDRHTSYFETQKALYYMIDKQSVLIKCYAIPKEFLPHTMKEGGLAVIRVMCITMRGYAEEYAGTHKIPTPTFEQYWMDMYLNMSDDGSL